VSESLARVSHAQLVLVEGAIRGVLTHGLDA
jgi:hypothetical protein